MGYNLRVNNDQAICTASLNGKLETVKYLYSMGLDPRINNNKSVKWAICNRHSDVVSFLLSKGCYLE